MAAVVVSMLVFASVVPFANRPLAQVPAFYPMYQSALIVCDSITAAFLFGQSVVGRSRGLLILAGGYVFSASMAISHALSFPGLFAPAGLLASGTQSTAWIYFFWHLGFPAAVIAYALTRERPLPDRPPRVHLRDVLAWIGVPVGAVIGLTALSTVGQDALPALMHGNDDLPAKYTVAWLTWLVTLGAVLFLWRRRLTVLDVWLAVVLFSLLCEVALAAVFNAGRYSLGWYAGRIYGLLSSSFVLVVLLLESFSLYARLTEAYSHAQRK